MPQAARKHGDAKRKAEDKRRGSAASRGYGWRWRNENGTGAADAFLRDHPWCEECLKEGRYEPATCVDHEEAHRGDMGKFWQSDNWRALCGPCHSVKTVQKDGGFGRVPSGLPPTVRR